MLDNEELETKIRLLEERVIFVEEEKERIETRLDWTEWIEFNSHWRTASSSEIALGTESTMLSMYKKNDYWLTALYIAEMGSGLIAENTAGAWEWSTPEEFPWVNPPLQTRTGLLANMYGSGFINDANSQFMLATPVLFVDNNDNTVIRLLSRAAITAGHQSFVGSSSPVIWAVSDTIRFSIMYPIG